MKLERAKCPDCGKTLAVQPPRGGDGSLDVFPRHKNKKGERCDRSRLDVKKEHYLP